MLPQILVALLLVSDPQPPALGQVNPGSIDVGVTVRPPEAPPQSVSPVATIPGYPKQSLVPACQANAACVTDLDCPGGTPYYIYVQSSPTTAPVNTLQSICGHDTQPADLGTIPDEALDEVRIEWARTPLDPGSERVTPGGDVPIGVPVVVQVLGARHVDEHLTLDDVPLHLMATESYAWDFGDATSLDTTSPGRSYDRARPPTDPAYASDYVLHTYDRPGTVTIVETTSWSHVVVTRTDTGATVTLPGRAAVSQQRVRRVVELRSELTTP